MAETATSAPPKRPAIIFKWSRWLDGENHLWIVAGTHGFDEQGIYGANVDLLDVDNEQIVEIPRSQFAEWVENGILTRETRPILM